MHHRSTVPFPHTRRHLLDTHRDGESADAVAGAASAGIQLRLLVVTRG
jgi:hypothetical protein